MAEIGSFNGTEKMEDISLKKTPSQKKVLLHGTLDVWIFAAKDLPNMDMMSERVRQCFTLFNSCGGQYRQRSKQHHHRKIITSDPYVSVQVAGATVAQTRVITNSQNPSWDEHFTIHLAHFAGKVEFAVKDNDLFGAELIGSVVIPAEEVLSGEKKDDWFPVLNSYGKPPKPDSSLHLSIQFIPVQADLLYKTSVGAGPENSGVPRTYFPNRKGGMVTLYQDAHVRDHIHLPIQLDGGKEFERGRCWEDICHAILEAHHLIYITGWSIYHKIKLVREPTKPLPEGGLLNLGELLKYKSQEGVRVLLLVWDDKTSHDKFLIKTVRLSTLSVIIHLLICISIPLFMFSVGTTHVCSLL